MGRELGRRAVLAGALALPLAACAGQDAAEPERPGLLGSRSAAPSRPVAPVAPSGPAVDRLAALERRFGGRLGVYAVHTGTGAVLSHRPDERFAFCSTFKAPAAAAVLATHPLSILDKVVRYTKADVDSISPVTEKHVDTGMTVRDLCDAAIRYSDGTAGNLLMREVGGPAGVTAYLRRLGDTVSRMDQYEPDLNRNPPGDPRDTTTPRALANVCRRMLLGDGLAADRRALMTDWMRRATTGSRSIRAGVPADWTVADKTGHGDYGRVCDVAVGWPPGGAPLVLAVLTERGGYQDTGSYAVITEAAREAVAALR